MNVEQGILKFIILYTSGVFIAKEIKKGRKSRRPRDSQAIYLT